MVHVNNLCRSATLTLCKIGKLWKYLHPVSTQKLIQAFVNSRLDNCNSLLYCLSAKDICKIQRVQNMAARLISPTKKRDHITPILLRDRLHWLLVDQRIQFKILLLTYKAFHGVAPSYLKDLITLYVPPRGLRAGNVCPAGNLISVSSRTKTYGERAFSVAAPTLRNAVPVHIHNSLTVAQFKGR